VAPGEQFAARESGETAGVVREDGQPVFASSKASKGKKAGSDAGTGSLSERSAVSDAWSGFSSEASAGGSRTPATASLGQQGSGSALGMAILGLGLVGMFGTFLMLVASRRLRAEVDPQDTSRRGRGPHVR